MTTRCGMIGLASRMVWRTVAASAGAALVAVLVTAGARAEPVADLRAGPTGKIEFRSLARDKAVIWGDLTLAPSGAARMPLMVLVHGSAGRNASREGRYAATLGKLGVATFALDSFGPRGVRRTVGNQRRVSGRTMIGDTFASLRILATHPRIDPRRIGVIGFSKGGTAALETAAPQFVQHYLGRQDLRFALHIMFYPWCGLQFRSIRPTPVPLLMIIGGSDDYTGVAPCRRYIERMQAAGLNARLVVYPGALHAFDMEALRGRLELRSAQNFRKCHALRDDDLWLIDPRTMRRMASLHEARAYFRSCMFRGASVGPDPAARHKAMAEVTRIVIARLVGGRSDKGATR
ncbi:MAG: dienelactone hydrolase family protein [Alphaproteobacteria bacterium]|nr:dienelactone hydrolase family protein [Alphaproteobacteria bacterium]